MPIVTKFLRNYWTVICKKKIRGLRANPSPEELEHLNAHVSSLFVIRMKVTKPLQFCLKLHMGRSISETWQRVAKSLMIAIGNNLIVLVKLVFQMKWGQPHPAWGRCQVRSGLGEA